jgi:hypothetical protein
MKREVRADVGNRRPVHAVTGQRGVHEAGELRRYLTRTDHDVIPQNEGRNAETVGFELEMQHRGAVQGLTLRRIHVHGRDPERLAIVQQ